LGVELREKHSQYGSFGRSGELSGYSHWQAEAVARPITVSMTWISPLNQAIIRTKKILFLCIGKSVLNIQSGVGLHQFLPFPAFAGAHTATPQYHTFLQWSILRIGQVASSRRHFLRLVRHAVRAALLRRVAAKSESGIFCARGKCVVVCRESCKLFVWLWNALCLVVCVIASGADMRAGLHA